MFEHFTTPQEIYCYKLGIALTMEQDALDLLADMEESAMRSDLSEILHDHAHETRRNIQNLKQCFTLAGQDATPQPSPATKGLGKESSALAAKTDNTLVDSVVLAGALSMAHHGIAVYEILVVQAKALGALGAAGLLGENLLQARAARERITAAAESVMQSDAEVQQLDDSSPDPVDSPTQAPAFLPPGSI